MNKKLLIAGLTGLMLMPIAPTGWAQPSGDKGGFSSRRNNPKFRLSGLWRGIGELEKSKTPLSKDQAKKVVGLVRPWTSKPKMTEEEAKKLYMGVNGVLTTNQKNELDKMAAMRRRTARPDDQKSGQRPNGGNFDPKKMAEMRKQFQKLGDFFKTSNPFYPPSKYKELKDVPQPMRDGMNRRYNAGHAVLVALVKKAGK